MKDGFSVDKKARSSEFDDSQIIDMFLQILRLTTKIRVSFLDDMFKQSTSIMLCDYTLEGFIGEGCGREKDRIENGLSKCPLHDNVCLTSLVI